MIEGVRLFDARLPVVPVEVPQLVVEAEVAVLHSIGVEHRNHLEDEELAQHEAGLAVTEQEADEALGEVGGRGFGGMHPCSQQDDRAVSQPAYLRAYLKGRSLALGNISSLKQGSLSE